MGNKRSDHTRYCSEKRGARTERKQKRILEDERFELSSNFGFDDLIFFLFTGVVWRSNGDGDGGGDGVFYSMFTLLGVLLSLIMELALCSFSCLLCLCHLPGTLIPLQTLTFAGCCLLKNRVYFFSSCCSLHCSTYLFLGWAFPPHLSLGEMEESSCRALCQLSVNDIFCYGFPEHGKGRSGR